MSDTLTSTGPILEALEVMVKVKAASGDDTFPIQIKYSFTLPLEPLKDPLFMPSKKRFQWHWAADTACRYRIRKERSRRKEVGKKERSREKKNKRRKEREEEEGEGGEEEGEEGEEEERRRRTSRPKASNGHSSLALLNYSFPI